MTDAINPTNGCASPWTDERETLLRKLFADGLSHSLIAQQIGGGITRNACIGKCRRLGLIGRESTTTMPQGRHGATTFTAPRRTRRIGSEAKLPRKSRIPLEPMAPKLAPEPNPCSLLELTRYTCRWPIGEPGEPGFYFCGAPGADVIENRPYCPYHGSIAGRHYQRPTHKPFVPRRGWAA